MHESTRNPRVFEIHSLNFDRIVGRNVLQDNQNKIEFLESLKPWILPKGFFIFVEAVPSLCQRLSELISEDRFNSEFLHPLKSIEDKICNDKRNPRCNWSPDSLRNDLESANWSIARWEVKEFNTPTRIQNN